MTNEQQRSPIFRLDQLKKHLYNTIWGIKQLLTKVDTYFAKPSANARVASHLYTGSLAGIGKLLALAGRYIRSVFCVL